MSSRYCGGLVIAAYFLLSATAARAQVMCSFSAAPSSAIMRSEGIAEQTADALLTCSSMGGFTPTPNGVPVPAPSFTLMFNAPITSRVLAGNLSEALLLIDEPQPENQRVCTDACVILGTGTGIGTYDGSAGRPNVFQGQLLGLNMIQFAGIPFDPPAFGQTRTLRFTNLRVDASTLSSLTAFLSVTGTTSISVPMPMANLGQAQPGLSSAVDAAAVLPACSAQNASLAHDAAAPGVAQFSVRMAEGFLNAFRPRSSAGYVDPNTSPNPVSEAGASVLHTSESGFVNLNFPTVAGHGELSRAGVADQGTRFYVQFYNVPANVKLFAPTAVPLSGTPQGVLRMIYDVQGAFTPRDANTNGLAPLAISGNIAEIAYEVLKANPGELEQANIPIYVAYDGGAPAPATITYRAVFAPMMSPGGTQTPRFTGLTGTPQTAFTIQACACATNVSSQVLVSRSGFRLSRATNRFEQTVSIKNTTAAAIAGPLVLAFDNLSANASLYTPAGVTSCASPASPFLNVIAQGSALAPGQTVTIPAAFLNPTQAAISYATRVLSGGTR